jgi:metal-responsive CopG/Arc/MetJ family transcriptional regulator
VDQNPKEGLVKAKIGAAIEENIMRDLKDYSARKGRSMSDVIQDALMKYLHGAEKNQDLRMAALKRLCSRPFDLTSQQWDEIMEEDYYDQ